MKKNGQNVQKKKLTRVHVYQKYSLVIPYKSIVISLTKMIPISTL